MRRREMKHEPLMRGVRWAIPKDPSTLTKKQLTDYHHITHANFGTSRAYRIKEAPRYILAVTQNSALAEALFMRWYSWACRSRLEPFKKLAASLKNHLNVIRALRFEAVEWPGREPRLAISGGEVTSARLSPIKHLHRDHLLDRGQAEGAAEGPDARRRTEDSGPCQTHTKRDGALKRRPTAAR